MYIYMYICIYIYIYIYTYTYIPQFSYAETWELVNLFVGTKMFSYHICYEN